ncbi:hypothetical protein [Pseudofulvimonas gallinarii]|jgi:hypothetical protein|uniref:DUF3352 domain-containing protein n=1 Tax=Pseudofulvimonas gallinarii TaxID=634155 RepID=A0A4R3LL20_9GAMM|nr:hypothetical protein [Pseudofulvimonas gallinarii]TCS99244.1 hypothetical protein EDC25_10682 [Pseudofulvimonas gallinarii]THD13952.1 hypothetical protein B1808_05550 [Pseudofulvimonas gallinarii]
MRIVVMLLAGLLGACSTSKKDLSSPLAYVPAETPYVFANLEAMPEATVQAYEEMLKPVGELYGTMLDELRAEVGKVGETEEEQRRIIGLIDLARDKMSIEGWERIGFSRRARAAIYGVGVMPVVRIELGDAAKLRAFMGEIEAVVGKAIPTAEVDGQTYWRMAPDESGSFAVVMAIIDQHLVLTLDAGPEVAALPDLLGLRQPARSLADAGTLQQLNREFGYTPYGTVLLDNRRLATALLGTDGNDTWFSRKLGRDGAALSSVCRAELMGMVEHLPRIIGGYTRIDGTGMDSHSLIELKPAVAQAFKDMVAPVPGLGGFDGRMPTEFGFGLKLDKLAEFIQVQANAVAAEPYRCPELADLNASARDIGRQTAGLYAAAGWFTGMRVVLQRLDWLDTTPDTQSIEGAVVIASPSPLGLIGMLKSFVPQLSSLELAPGAAPQRLPADGLEDAPPSWIGLNDVALAIGVGEGAEAQVPAFLGAAAPARPPLLHFSYQGAFYGGLMRKYSEIVNSITESALDQIWDGDPGAMNDEDKARKLERQRGRERSETVQRYIQRFGDAFNSMYDAVDYTAGSLVPVDRGLEFLQVMRVRR